MSKEECKVCGGKEYHKLSCPNNTNRPKKINMKQRYINRYDDEYQFTLLENGDVLWQGPFKHYHFHLLSNDNV